MNKLLYSGMLLLYIALLSACGSGSDGTSGGTIQSVIKASALAASQNVASIQLTITLPAGVTPPFLADGTTVDPVATVKINSTATSGQALPGATFIPATATAPGRLTIAAMVADGFKPTDQDQITIHLNVAVGTFPKETDFTLISFLAWDAGGVPVVLEPTLTTTIE